MNVRQLPPPFQDTYVIEIREARTVYFNTRRYTTFRTLKHFASPTRPQDNFTQHQLSVIRYKSEFRPVMMRFQTRSFRPAS